MTKPADELEKFKLSAAKVISVGSPGDNLRDLIDKTRLFTEGQKVLSANEKLLDHDLNRQRFSLRFLSIVVLPATFLVGVVVPDEKIKTSCLGMVSLIIGALIQESGSQRNPKIDEENKE